MLDVIAQLRDASVNVPGLTVGRAFGSIVTGNASTRDLRRIRAHPNVVSLKAARGVIPQLQRSVRDAKASPSDLRTALPARLAHVTGAGTVVGVIDDGCDFAHPNFRTAAGDSRLLFLWDQTGDAMAESPQEYGYGREFTRRTLTNALRTAAPYGSIGYTPNVGAHGTHVLDIAAGNGRGTGAPGVAHGADIIFVQLGKPDYAERESLGNSRRLLEAVEYVFLRAEAAGASATVVNLSLVMHGGPHDGTTLVDQAFATMVAVPGRAIVVAAGNAGNGATHASGSISAGQPRTLDWDIHPADMTDNEIEIWYTGTSALTAALRSPDGAYTLSVEPNTPVQQLRIKNRIVATAASVRDDPTNGDHQINLFLRRGAPKGRWTVLLQTNDLLPLAFHAWIERDDFGRLQQSAFGSADRDTSYSLGTLSCSNACIVVAAHNPDDPTKPICAFSSRGPTRRGDQKPDISAPGEAITAANARTPGVHALSGTSQAAPHVAGAIALMCEAAAPRKPDAAAIRHALIEGAHGNQKLPWRADAGAGPLNVTNAIAVLLR